MKDRHLHERFDMKAFVITIKNIEQSVQAAQRCIKSGKDHGLPIEMYYGFTPDDNPENILEEKGVSLKGFQNNQFSQYLRMVAAFTSHRSLWEKCANQFDNFVIFEHDCILDQALPSTVTYTGEHDIISFGAPSYGKYNTPTGIGVVPLTSKQYFPGAHCYMLTPKGAKEALKKAETNAAPTDIFFNTENFPNIKEFYPWPARVVENFTTIQMERGCLAKHSYGEGYRIL